MNIAQNVVRARRLFPQTPAIIFEGTTWTYEQLDQDSNRIANGLHCLGIRKGDRVALFLPNIPAFASTFLGVQKIGGIAVSVNASLKTNEVEFILSDSEAKAVVTTAALVSHVPQDKLPTLQHVFIAEGESEQGRSLDDFKKSALPDPCLVQMNRQDPAAILYTSGTTGFPKGATLSHGNVISNMNSFNYNCGMRPDDRLLLYLPLFHCFGQNAIMNSCFNVGATLVLQRTFKPEDVHKAILEDGITMFFGVPTTFLPVYQRVSVEEMKNVRYSFSAAAILPLEIAEKWRAKYNQPVYEGYGLTETSPFASYNHRLKFKPGSIGEPIENVEMRVVDEKGNEVAPGELGELAISGPNVMLGYWNRPQETAKVVRNGWFHSGDLGRMDEDGYYFIVDRVKDMINVGGLKVYPAEVEHVLYEHDAVAEAAVYGVPDPMMGEKVWANLVLHEGQTVSVEEITEFCKDRIAAFKVPVSFHFVSSLPKNPVGKLLKRVLREQAPHLKAKAEGQAESPAESGEHSAETISAWMIDWLDNQLAVSRDEIQAHKPFWDYGVTSVLAVKMSEEMSAWLGEQVNPVLFWNFPSIASLISRLTGGSISESEASVDVEVRKPPTRPQDEVPAAEDLEDLSDDEMARLLAEELAEDGDND